MADDDDHFVILHYLALANLDNSPIRNPRIVHNDQESVTVPAPADPVWQNDRRMGFKPHKKTRGPERTDGSPPSKKQAPVFLVLSKVVDLPRGVWRIWRSVYSQLRVGCGKEWMIFMRLCSASAC